MLQASGGYLSYRWYYNNTLIPGATADTLSYSQNGDYVVWVTDLNGCEGFSDPYFVGNVGVSGIAGPEGVRVYPNPTGGLLHIDAPVKVQVAVYDLAGKLILRAVDVKVLDLGDVSDGMYLLYVSDLKGRVLRVEKLSKAAR